MYDYKRGFIRLPYMIRNWTFTQWPSAYWRAIRTSSCSFQKVGDSEKEEPIMQPQSKTNVIWKLPGQSLIRVHLGKVREPESNVLK